MAAPVLWPAFAGWRGQRAVFLRRRFGAGFPVSALVQASVISRALLLTAADAWRFASAVARPRAAPAAALAPDSHMLRKGFFLPQGFFIAPLHSAAAIAPLRNGLYCGQRKRARPGSCGVDGFVAPPQKIRTLPSRRRLTGGKRNGRRRLLQACCLPTRLSGLLLTTGNNVAFSVAAK
jgi:hypothetical protein